MTRRGNRGKVQPRLFHRFHRAWKSRNRRGIPTFPQPRRRRVSLTPKGEPRQNRGSRQILAESGKIREVANELEGLKAFITPRQEKVTVNEILDDLVEHY